MKFGLYTQTRDPDYSVVLADLIDQVKEQVVLCEQGGFEYVYPDEHHFRVGFSGTTNPISVSAMLVAHTSRIRFGLVMLPANWHPLRMAEDVTYLDHLSKGRVEVSLGRGASRATVANLNPQLKDFWPNRDQQFDPSAQVASREHFAEFVEIIKTAWTEDLFSHKGRYYEFPQPGLPAEGPGTPDPVAVKDGEIVKIGLGTKPYQKPYPPLRMLVHSEGSYKESARLGMRAMVWINPPNKLRERLEIYAHARTEQEGREFAVGEAACALKLFYVAPTYEEAKRDTDHLYTPHMGNYGPSSLYNYVLDEDEEMPKVQDWEFWRKRNMIIAGSPEQVAEQLHEVDERYHLENLALWTQGSSNRPGAGLLTHKQTMRSIELFSTKVLPLFANGKSKSREKVEVAQV